VFPERQQTAPAAARALTGASGVSPGYRAAPRWLGCGIRLILEEVEMRLFVATPIDPLRLQRSLTVLRWLLAGLIAIHGWFRFLSGGYAPFGEFLTLQGFPLGGWIAIAVTAYEIIGTPLLAMGRAVLPLCLGYVGIYLMGIALVHYPAGWFVVGAGRNGMEYSVLLVACLLLVAWQYWPARRA